VLPGTANEGLETGIPLLKASILFHQEIAPLPKLGKEVARD
jgi:hypothetical protein